METLPQHLGNDIVVEILSRIPVKSLLRFISVCMLWRSIIMDPKFASMQLNRSLQTPLTILKTVSTRGEVLFRSISHDLTPLQDFGDFPWTAYRNKHLRIIGSCNGLLVIDNWFDFFIWNPLTNCGKRIDRPPYSAGYTSLSGLCCDSSLDNYKLVLALPGGRANIFSFKSNSWKQIKILKFDIPCGESKLATLVDGVPHWRIRPRKSGPGSNHIVRFDLVDDEFKRVAQPDWFQEDFSWLILNFNGCLSILGHTKNWVELWTMTDSGIKDSWSKMFVSPVPDVIQLTTYDVDYWKPWYFTPTGAILVKLEDGGESIIYNPKEGTYEVIIQSVGGSQSVPFVESLVSPMSL